jgi:hypothetical protein
MRRPRKVLTEDERKRLEEIESLKAMRPRPDARVAPSLEEFAAWTEHPVTRYVAAAWLAGARMQREAWAEASWNSGKAEPQTLGELRTRADAYSAFLETGLERYVELNTQDR